MKSIDADFILSLSLRQEYIRFGMLLALMLAAIATGSEMQRHVVAAEPEPIVHETREFAIRVDDLLAGSCTLTIDDYPGLRTIAHTSARVKMAVLLYTYVYQFDGSEEWINSRLCRLVSQGVDGLSKFSLKAEITTRGLNLQTLSANKLMPTVPVITNNYWRLPPAEMLDKSIVVLSADTGKQHRLQFHRVTDQELILLTKRVTCQYYKVTGDLELELWFDGNGRLVRQIGKEEGRVTELSLTGYQRVTIEPQVAKP